LQQADVKAYASTLFRATPDDTKRAVAGYLAQGFRAIKFGWGAFGHDLNLDIRLLQAARAEAGPNIDLMVDGGWYGVGYDDPFRPRAVKDWIRLVETLEALDIFWLEDFLHPENFSGYGEVARATRKLRIAAGEQLAGYADFARLATEGHAHTLQPDLSRCGGLTVGRQVAEMTQRLGIDCVPHAWLTDLLKAASLHLNAYLMHSLYLEYNVSSASILNHLCKQSLPMVDGYIEVPQGPGLGVEVDETMIAKFRVA
jgi:L-alanine-DL-glutamate epimerase-like enolase superfamily enzyme